MAACRGCCEELQRWSMHYRCSHCDGMGGRGLLTTKRTKCAYCGRRLKPETGHSPLNPLKLNPTTARHDVCRACGREQPPGTEFTDLVGQFKGRRQQASSPKPSVGRPSERKIAGQPTTEDHPASTHDPAQQAGHSWRAWGTAIGTVIAIAAVISVWNHSPSDAARDEEFLVPTADLPDCGRTHIASCRERTAGYIGFEGAAVNSFALAYDVCYDTDIDSLGADYANRVDRPRSGLEWHRPRPLDIRG